MLLNQKTATALAVTIALSTGLGACVDNVTASAPDLRVAPAHQPVDSSRYAALTDHGFSVPEVPISTLKSRNERQLVSYATDEPAGTIIVDTPHRFLYLVMPGGKAMRYGVGVGKEGLAFQGTATINRKSLWPHWTPTPDMIHRNPALYEPWKKGMDGGERNPLGARALYLFQNGKDTLYRIHGTNEPDTIGHAVSSGCIRMMNQDVIDLYNRVPVGSKVVVNQ